MMIALLFYEHISSLSIPKTSDISDIFTLSYVEIILLLLTSPHNSNRQQIDCTIQYHEASRPFISSYQRVDTSTYQRVDTLLVRLVLIYLDTH